MHGLQTLWFTAPIRIVPTMCDKMVHFCQGRRHHSQLHRRGPYPPHCRSSTWHAGSPASSVSARRPSQDGGTCCRNKKLRSSGKDNTTVAGNKSSLYILQHSSVTMTTGHSAIFKECIPQQYYTVCCHTHLQTQTHTDLQKHILFERCNTAGKSGVSDHTEDRPSTNQNQLYNAVVGRRRVCLRNVQM